MSHPDTHGATKSLSELLDALEDELVTVNSDRATGTQYNYAKKTADAIRAEIEQRFGTASEKALTRNDIIEECKAACGTVVIGHSAVRATVRQQCIDAIDALKPITRPAGESADASASGMESRAAAPQERPLNTNGGHDTGHIGPQSECVVARGEAPRVPAGAASPPSAGEFSPLKGADLAWITGQLDRLVTHYGMVPYDRNLIDRVVEILKASAPSSARFVRCDECDPSFGCWDDELRDKNPCSKRPSVPSCAPPAARRTFEDWWRDSRPLWPDSTPRKEIARAVYEAASCAPSATAGKRFTDEQIKAFGARHDLSLSLSELRSLVSDARSIENAADRGTP